MLVAGRCWKPTSARYRRGRRRWWLHVVYRPVMCCFAPSVTVKNSSRPVWGYSGCWVGDRKPQRPLAHNETRTRVCAFQTVGRKFGSAATGWTLQSSWCASVRGPRFRSSAAAASSRLSCQEVATRLSLHIFPLAKKKKKKIINFFKTH